MTTSRNLLIKKKHQKQQQQQMAHIHIKLFSANYFKY